MNRATEQQRHELAAMQPEISLPAGQLEPFTVALNAMATEIHRLARFKKWHAQDATDDAAFMMRAVANLHGEVSELWEAFRNHTLCDHCDKSADMVAAGLPPLTNLEEELADIIIRVLDDAARLGVNIGRAVAIKHRFNFSRPDRHGGKAA